MKLEDMITPLVPGEPREVVLRQNRNDMVRILCKQLAAAKVGDSFIVGAAVCSRASVSLCMTHVGYALERYFSSYTDEDGNVRVQRQL
jgi:hypothetical protein